MGNSMRFGPAEASRELVLLQTDTSDKGLDFVNVGQALHTTPSLAEFIKISQDSKGWQLSAFHLAEKGLEVLVTCPVGEDDQGAQSVPCGFTVQTFKPCRITVSPRLPSRGTEVKHTMSHSREC